MIGDWAGHFTSDVSLHSGNLIAVSPTDHYRSWGRSDTILELGVESS
jgi:hypothetical protein